jgi:serine/threonine-protein kinase ULK4
MNEYHIYDKIGKGKYSTVYKGRRKKTISYYAIKSVDKSQKARVLQEVRVAA